MSVINRLGGYGQLVVGTAKNLPATATGNIFAVAGAPVLLTGIIGVVTTAIQAQATTLTVGNTPTGGAAGNASLGTSLDINGKTVGTVIAVQRFASGTGVAQVLTAVNVGVLGAPTDAGGIGLVAPGNITITTGATSTGQIQWYCTYVPLPGAIVTAV